MVTAIGGVALVLVQIRMARESAADSAKDVQASLEVARRAAGAAERAGATAAEGLALTREQLGVSRRAAHVSERSLRDRERPWLTYESLSPVNDAPGEWPEWRSAELIVRNIGPLPAFRVRAKVASEVGITPPLLAQVGAQGPLATAASGKGLPLLVLLAHPSPELLSVSGGDGWRVYVVARVEYLDQFNKPHSSTFCQFLDVVEPGQTGFLQKRHWKYCAQHNEMN